MAQKGKVEGREAPTHPHTLHTWGGLAPLEVCGPPHQLVPILLGGPAAGSESNRTMEPLNAELLASAGSGSALEMP